MQPVSTWQTDAVHPDQTTVVPDLQHGVPSNGLLSRRLVSALTPNSVTYPDVVGGDEESKSRAFPSPPVLVAKFPLVHQLLYVDSEGDNSLAVC